MISLNAPLGAGHGKVVSMSEKGHELPRHVARCAAALHPKQPRWSSAIGAALGKNLLHL
jgi:hypothetical protein